MTAGFPEQLLSGLVEVILRELRRSSNSPQQFEQGGKFVVIPYLHGVSHHIKKAAARTNVNVIYSAPIKLAVQESELKPCKSAVQEEACHPSRARSSRSAHILSQHLHWTDRSLREHTNNIRAETGSNVAIHCAVCGCTPNFHQTRIVRRYEADEISSKVDELRELLQQQGHLLDFPAPKDEAGRSMPKPPLNIPKYKGTPEDVPIDKWLQLFDMMASEASWTHRERVSHFSEYIEGEAFKWYLTEIFSNVETWDDIKRAMQNRFATTDGDAFRLFIHYRLKGGQTIKEYYEEKKATGLFGQP
ncbi:hypothetical protein HPB50_004044 [Hyalomma asiaticum]|uniref:Uncharacterized protein n=1 Tax=Hyalomma asiaticum TaxID=266040 RepID=A0ACB7SGH0_HYAAI|nr:hypothetical protein HPB50_004044 [Hyalomma asiaticum]